MREDKQEEEERGIEEIKERKYKRREEGKTKRKREAEKKYIQLSRSVTKTTL